MNEEQAVLDFFAKPENLSLGLSVAEQMDEIRFRLISEFWKDLGQRLNASLQHTEWQTLATEDRNAAELLVGLQCKLREPQTICVFPMMEQQLLGNTWRIFFGLMWQTPPTPEQLALPAVSKLKELLSDAGFKNNENFLAWQWTPFYPYRRDFLLRSSQKPEQLLESVEAIFNTLLKDHRSLIAATNTALKDMPRSMTVSLDQLRRKRSD